MGDKTVINYKFIDANPEITKYLPKFIEGSNDEIINQNLINTQAGFLDSAACKNAYESLDNNNQKNVNIVFESEKGKGDQKGDQKEDFNNKENMNSQSSTFGKIINWVIIAFFIIFGLLILGYFIINWDLL